MLKIKPNPRRYLLAFMDTEGGILETPLRELSMLVSYIIKSDKDFKKMQYEGSVFHLLNFQLSCETEKPILRSHLHAINLLLKAHTCDGLICVAWNAKHDAKVMCRYFVNKNVHFVDAITWAKKLTKFNSYKQSNIMKKYDMGIQEHSSLMDAIDMMSIMKYIQIDYETNGKLSVEDIKIETGVQGSDRIFERIINSNLLKPFSIAGISNKDENYSVYEIVGVKYKVRKGFENASSQNYKGYGLYEYNDLKNRYVLIKERAKKISVIESIVTKHFK